MQADTAVVFPSHAEDLTRDYFRRHRGTAFGFLAGLFLLILSSTPMDVAAQTLQGRVLEEGREVPIGGAVISLVDQAGERRAEAITDSLGRFSLTPPEAGEYSLEVVRLGYQITRSPLLALSTEGSVPFEIMMDPAPIGLEGLEVSVENEAEQFLRTLGHSRVSLGRRWIDRAGIEELPTALRAADVIRWQGAPGVFVRTTGGPPAATPLCIGFWRAGTIRSAEPPCAITFLNGARIDSIAANQITPEEIEAIAILNPLEAAQLYGTQGGGGAVLIWLRRGGG